jgi:hypothetical protein
LIGIWALGICPYLDSDRFVREDPFSVRIRCVFGQILRFRSHICLNQKFFWTDSVISWPNLSELSRDLTL